MEGVYSFYLVDVLKGSSDESLCRLTRSLIGLMISFLFFFFDEIGFALGGGDVDVGDGEDGGCNLEETS